MCGITAVSRAIDSSIPDIRHFMRIAALAIEERGRDATGFAWTTEGGSSWYWKTPRRAREAIKSAPLDLDATTVIGHTRASTQGDKSDNANNHPVLDDGILLVHNGVIHNDFTLFREHFGKDYKRKAQVDTQIIASMLAHRDTVFDGMSPGELFELLRGDAALAWIELADANVLNLARVQGRPLTLGWTRKGDLVMSSTPETLANLALWSNLRIKKVREVEEGRHLKVVAGEIVDESTFTPRKYGWTSPYTNSDAGTRFSPHPTTKTTTTTAPPAKSDDKADAEWWEHQLMLEEIELEAMLESGMDDVLDVNDLRDIRDETIADMAGERPDGIDWDNLVPRRGWKDRIRDAVTTI